MYGMFEDEDDIFMGSPKSKFMDVVFNANNDIVRQELEIFMDKFAAMELMLSQHVGDDIDKEVKRFAVSNQSDVDTKAKSLYIELMGAILSQSE
ncbi:MAG: DUF2018 family protein [Sulfurimonas sp.]|nr:DUF2018 family protein [Sulfurimonas sp.]